MALLPMHHLFLLFLLFLLNLALSFSSMMLFSSTLFCPLYLSPTSLPFQCIHFLLYRKPWSSLVLPNTQPLTHSKLTKFYFLHPSFPLIVVPVNGHVDLKTSLTPPLITHTAATPMPIPKLPVCGDPIVGYESRRGSNVSIDPACYDKSPVCILILSHTHNMWQF